MPIIVEDGTIVPGANSYGTREGATEYLVARGHVEWPTLTEEQQDALLIRAGDVLNSYGLKGSPVDPFHTMTMPRIGLEVAPGVGVPQTVIPSQFVRAQYEIAGAMASSQEDPLEKVDRSAGAITSVSVAGAVSVGYSAPDANQYSGATGFPAVDALLAPFLSNQGGSFFAVEIGRG